MQEEKTTRVRRDGIDKRNLILAEAARVFAERGYREATHAEICGRCSVNAALVNYHFSDKETLYRLAWQYARRQTEEKYPPDGGVPAEAPASARLRGAIGALVRSSADPNCCDREIWRKELARPTGLLAEIRQQAVVPLRRRFGAILRELIGPNSSDESLRLATMSVIAQCRVPVTKNSSDNRDGPYIQADLDRRIEHIVRFSLGGLAAIKEQSDVDDVTDQQNETFGACQPPAGKTERSADGS